MKIVAGVKRRDRKHDAEAIRMSEGWLAICASCSWVGREYRSQEESRAEAEEHVRVAMLGECVRRSFEDAEAG